MARRLVTWALLCAGALALACARGSERASSALGPAPDALPAASVPDDCDAPDKTGSQRVKCKFDALADQGIATADALAASTLREHLSPAQRQAVDNAKARLGKEKERGASRMASLTRKRESTCSAVECDSDLYPACAAGNHDGVCDEKAGEECLEVVGDGIGDDVQPCAPTKGARREECVQVCDDEAVCREEENLDPALQAHLESALDEATGHAKAVERRVREVEAVAASALTALAQVQADGDACALDAAGHERTSDEVARGFKIAAEASRSLADVSERACDQTVLGFSCGACCAPFEIVAATAAMASDLIEVIGDVVDSATLDAALACVAEVDATASANDAEMELIRQALLRVEAAQQEAIRLLQTPPGQRPEFPQP